MQSRNIAPAGLPQVSKLRAAPTPALSIQRIITCDDPFGEPCPPAGSCSVVRRARGFTLWRRLFLAPSSVTDWRTAPEEFNTRAISKGTKSWI